MPGAEAVLAHFADRPFAGYRHFEFRVASRELMMAVQALKRRWPKLAKLSEAPSDYQLTHINANPEVSAPAGSRGRLGLALRNIQVDILAPAPMSATGKAKREPEIKGGQP